MSPTEPVSPEQPAFSRRTALKLAATGLVGGALGVGSTALITRLGHGAPPAPYRFFTATEAGLLIEICEQLIPRDASPGATDTGAIHYIDRQLAGFFARFQPTYRRGLAAFHQTCLQEYKLPFQELPPAKKIAALQSLERGQVPKALWADPTPQAFFNLVLAHTMQSFYGSPRHGGNRDYASYRMLGLDYPQFVGQNRYRPT